MIRGTEKHQEVRGNDDWRDARSPWEKIKDSISSPEGGLVTGLLLIGCMWIFPLTMLVSFLLGMFIFRWLSKKTFALPFRMPETSGLLDPNSPKHGTESTPTPAQGIAFLGNELKTNKELWFTDSDMRTHLLVFGSTGAGKALRNDEWIHTPEGWKKNKELKVGDYVSTPDGESSQITGIFPQGEKRLWKLSFEDGRSIKVSEDHLWEIHHNVYDEDFDPNISGDVISTLEVQNRIYRSEHCYIPLTQPIEMPELALNYPMELIVEKTISLMMEESHFPLVTKLTQSSIAQRQEFLSLLLASIRNTELSRYIDGSGLIYFKNKKMANDIQFILRSLGYFAIVESSPVEDIESPQDTKFVLTFQQQPYLRVVSVDKTEEMEECQCIKIAARNGLFITKDWIVTHNTETLISLAFNTLVQGSGFIYVDGKGDNTLWAKIFSIARSVGREDDVLVLNYMTGGRDVFGPQISKLSNTLNPFISGSAGGLTELLVGLMDEAGGDNAMWKGRAISLVSGIMMALVWLRDNEGLLLDVDQIRKYLILEEIQNLAKRRDLPPNISEAIKSYLVSLPGYNPNAPNGKQSETANDQHGYLQMQFTKILGSLSDTYGYIFRTNLGEIDFFDVVVNRRILVVLLPALEKSIDELGNLGKIVVACIKSMMATGLGDTLEGDYADVIEIKPTNSPAPYMCILDEYGYYVVKGAAVMPAQARSLGFSMVFAGQDYPAFKKNNNSEEAVSTIGNCNIKIFMKVEDPTDTFDLFKQSVGQAMVKTSSGMERQNGILGANYQDGQNIKYDKRDRGDLLDLKDQREGEAHIIFKSTLVRAKMFYAQPERVDKLQLNHFLRVEPPKRDQIIAFEASSKELLKHLKDDEYMQDLVDSTESNLEIEHAVNIINYGRKNKLSDKKISAGIVGFISNLSYDSFEDFKTKMTDFDISDEEEKINIFSTDRNYDDDMSYEELENKSVDEIDDDDEEHIPVFLSEERTRSSLMDMEKAMGSSDDVAEIRTSQVIEDMTKASEYPRSPVPEPKENIDDIMSIIETLEQECRDDS